MACHGGGYGYDPGPGRGRSSGVERNLAKVEVVGSNPIARSNFSPENCGFQTYTDLGSLRLATEQPANVRVDTHKIRTVCFPSVLKRKTALGGVSERCNSDCICSNHHEGTDNGEAT